MELYTSIFYKGVAGNLALETRGRQKLFPLKKEPQFCILAGIWNAESRGCWTAGLISNGQSWTEFYC